ncbi:MAG: APC family permease, partial [Spirochaetota bacterium]
MKDIQADAAKNPHLKRALKPVHVGALALGAIIGWGNFLLPDATILPRSGFLGSLIGFAAAAILMSFIVLTYGYMIKRVPVAGGEFSYGYAGYGVVGGFVSGWAILFLYLTVVCANLMGIGLVFRVLAPKLFVWGKLYEVAGWPVYTGEVIFLFIVMLVFAYTNYRGIVFSGRLQVVLAGGILLGVVVLFIGSLLYPESNAENLKPVIPEGKTLWSSVVALIALTPFLLSGFDTVPQAAEEYDFDPTKTTKLMLFAIIAGTLVYALTTYSVALLVPVADMQQTVKDSGAPF